MQGTYPVCGTCTAEMSAEQEHRFPDCKGTTLNEFVNFVNLRKILLCKRRKKSEGFAAFQSLPR